MRRAIKVAGVGLLAASASSAAFFQYGNFHVADARPLHPNCEGRRRKVIVVGGGIVGTCTAYILLERGFQVKVLEAGPRDGMQAASAGNGGTLGVSSAGHSLASWTNLQKIADAVKQQWKTVSSEEKQRQGADDGHRKSVFVDKGVLLDPDFILWGLCWLKLLLFNKDRSHDGWKERNITAQQNIFEMAERAGCSANAHMTKNGRLSAEVLPAFGGNVLSTAEASKLISPQECAALLPALDGARIAGARYIEGDGVGDCGAFCREVAKVCEKNQSCDWLYNCGAERLLIGSSGEVVGVADEQGQEHRADAVIVCGGVGSRALMKTAGIFIPVYGMRGYSVTLPFRADARRQWVPRKAPPHCIVSPFSLYIAQYGDRIRFSSYGFAPSLALWPFRTPPVTCKHAFRTPPVTCKHVTCLAEAGEASELAIESAALTHACAVAGELTVRREGTPELHARLDALVKFLFPRSEEFLDWDAAEHWHGDRPLTPDCQPLVGLTARRGLYINAGHSFNGWRESAISAKLCVDVIEAGTNHALGPIYQPLVAMDRMKLV